MTPVWVSAEAFEQRLRQERHRYDHIPGIGSGVVFPDHPDVLVLVGERPGFMRCGAISPEARRERRGRHQAR